MIRKVLKKLYIVLWNVFHEFIYLFIKRDKTIVLFGGWFGYRFSDNPRALYQYLSKNKQELGLTHVVWVTRNQALQSELTEKGYEAYMIDSEESIYYHKRAGYHLICNSSLYNDDMLPGDILPQYSNGAKKINLWHGLGGIKGVNYASGAYLKNKEKHPKKTAILEFIVSRKWYRIFVEQIGGWGNCKYLSTTPFQTEIFQQYFLKSKEYFVEAGYPRNARCLEYLEEEKGIIEFLSQKKNRILYAPTFRDDSSNYINPVKSDSFCKMLQEKDVLWIQKAHGAKEEKNYSVDIETSSILYIPSTFDINIVLPFVDLVVTDYSSVAWDALYHKKPISYYVPDFSYYRDSDRGFILEPEEFMFGQISYTLEELEAAIGSYKDNYDAFLPSNLTELWEKTWGRTADCKKIWEAIRENL